MCSTICHFLWALSTGLLVIPSPIVYSWGGRNLQCMDMGMDKLGMDTSEGGEFLALG